MAAEMKRHLCGTDNEISASVCRGCGANLPKVNLAQLLSFSATSRQQGNETHSSSNRYPALRANAALMQILAYVILGSLVLLVIVATAAGGFIGFFMSIIIAVIIGGSSWLLLKSYSELIYVQLDIEDNTRRTAEASEERDKRAA